MRTLYDGLTFDVIKQSPTLANGMFTDSYETGIRWGNTGRPTGDRYRYLGDDDAKDKNRYFYLDENTYKTVNTRYRGERTSINVNGTIAAQTTSDYGAEYFTTDLLGSVRITSDTYGIAKSTYTYDAFGTLVQDDPNDTTDYGYLGKPYDPTAHLYNYGYRDYSPTTARFTTIDPIRDGQNWFNYCNADPVNYTDPNGLFVLTALLAKTAIGAVSGAVIGFTTNVIVQVGFNVINQAVSGNDISLKDAVTNVDLKAAGSAALSGAISGAITGGAGAVKSIAMAIHTSKVASAVLNTSANMVGTTVGTAVDNISHNKSATDSLALNLSISFVTGCISGITTKTGTHVIDRTKGIDTVLYSKAIDKTGMIETLTTVVPNEIDKDIGISMGQEISDKVFKSIKGK